MSLYVLDTNMLSLYQAGHPVVVRRKSQQCPPRSWPPPSSAWTNC